MRQKASMEREVPSTLESSPGNRPASNVTLRPACILRAACDMFTAVIGSGYGAGQGLLTRL